MSSNSYYRKFKIRTANYSSDFFICSIIEYVYYFEEAESVCQPPPRALYRETVAACTSFLPLQEEKPGAAITIKNAGAIKCLS
jgi:hypothetical protein